MNKADGDQKKELSKVLANAQEHVKELEKTVQKAEKELSEEGKENTNVQVETDCKVNE